MIPRILTFFTAQNPRTLLQHHVSSCPHILDSLYWDLVHCMTRAENRFTFSEETRSFMTLNELLCGCPHPAPKRCIVWSTRHNKYRENNFPEKFPNFDGHRQMEW